jgi:hypothetical protein
MKDVVEIIQVSLIASMFSFLGEPGMIFWRYRRLIMRLPDWLNKPLGSCHLCFTGQCCLWYYLIVHFNEYNLLNHLFFISAGIFLSSIYALIYYAQND